MMPHSGTLTLRYAGNLDLPWHSGSRPFCGLMSRGFSGDKAFGDNGEGEVVSCSADLKNGETQPIWPYRIQIT